MVTIDQVILLEQKVESAVAKIQQLQAENDALRIKCSELTNALSSKSEQLSSLEVDQNQIENGILKALDRLNSIENSVLKAAGQAAPLSKPQPVQSQEKIPEPVQSKPEIQDSFETMSPVASTFEEEPEENEVSEEDEILIPRDDETSSIPNPEDSINPFDSDFTTDEAPEEENTDDLGFDIF